MKQTSRRTFLTHSSYALASFVMPLPLLSFSKYKPMTDSNTYEVIIIGGSYSGLSAGMTLGRSLRNVLIIDNGKPCNAQTPHSHNFITQDGNTPREISTSAKKQVEAYETVKFYSGLATNAIKTPAGFEVTTDKNDTFTAGKLIFATGVKDIMPDIPGFADCWGRTIIHCPYCHGYEVKHEKTGILANGDIAFHYAQLIHNWTKDLTIFTNGDSTFSQQQSDRIRKHNIPIIEKKIASFQHVNGNLSEIVFEDNSTFPLKAVYARPAFEQHCKIPIDLGCELTEMGHLKVDMFQKTTVEGISACGDSTSPFRAVSYAVSTGNIAAAALNNGMTEEEF